MTSSNEERSAGEDTVMGGADHPPRKRTKVSRACDACRKKKVKCDAEYSSTIQKVMKKCNNCTKNNDECTFSRIPLKRGPSKGYIKEPEDRLENKSRNGSIDRSQKALPFPSNSITRAPPTTGPPTVQPGSSPPIILPPLMGYQSKQQVFLASRLKYNGSTSTNEGSNPSSPRGSLSVLLNNQESVQGGAKQFSKESPPIQGPFWKVPYEMPHNEEENHRRRKSSVDSTSSTSTNGSRSSRVSLKPSISITSDTGVISDSDLEDFYSVQSRRLSSQSLSPRNSISSLSSLNGRLSANLNLLPPSQVAFPVANTSQPIHQPHLHYPVYHQLQTHVVQQPQAVPSPTYSSFNTIDANLNIYYSNFHLNFPILPFDETYLLKMIQESDSHNVLVDLFNLTLTHLNNFQNVSLSDNVRLLTRIVNLYPLNNVGIPLNDISLILFMSSLIVLNYAILLSGEMYTLGISTAKAIFNDFKVSDNFTMLMKQHHHTVNDYDNIKFYLPKLYFCLNVIENIYCLNFGVQNNVDINFMETANTYLRYIIPLDLPNIGIVNMKNFVILTDLVPIRHSSSADIESLVKNKTHIDNLIAKWNNESFETAKITNSTAFSNYFLSLVVGKYELIKNLIEVFNFLTIDHNDEEEFYENLNDYHLKLIRLVKKLSNSIISFSNYISTSTNSNELMNPLLNIAFAQLFKLIKLSKLIIDSLTENVDSDKEVVARCTKVNKDLSISFNLLNLVLNNTNIISGARHPIKEKVNKYNLNFSSNMEITKGSIKDNFAAWKSTFCNVIVPFISREVVEGWY